MSPFTECTFRRHVTDRVAETYQSVSERYRHAREVRNFMLTDLMQTLRWMRLYGDTVVAIGAVAFCMVCSKLMLTRGEMDGASEGLPAEA